MKHIKKYYFYYFILHVTIFLPLVSSEIYRVRYYLQIRKIVVECRGAPGQTIIECFNLANRLQRFEENELFQTDQPVQIDDTPFYLPLQRQQQQQRIINIPSPTNQRIVNNLVLMLTFTNHMQRYRFSQLNYSNLFNANDTDNELYPTGSIQYFFKRQSYGQIIMNSTVLPWFNSSFSEADVAAGCSAICIDGFNALSLAVNEALTYFDSQNLIDFPIFDRDNNGHLDMLTIITSSRGAEAGYIDDLNVTNKFRIWSHRNSLYKPYSSIKENIRVGTYNINPSLFGTKGNLIVRLGIITHELGHMFGLPDFYDRDASSSGLQNYDIMANAWHGSQLYPPSFSPWCKERMGIVEFKQLQEGWNTINPSNLVSKAEIYKLELDNNEAVYIDYQIPIENMERHFNGIIIHHCDNRVSRNNDIEWYPALHQEETNKYPFLKHYKCRVIQANSLFKLEKSWISNRDRTMYYGQPENLGLSLTDFGDNNVNSWTNLEKILNGTCIRLGHQISNFTRIDDETYQFWYHFNRTVAGTNCSLPVPKPTPTSPPTPFPTRQPTGQPTRQPTQQPTPQPTEQPTQLPTLLPTQFPTAFPTQFPTTTPPVPITPTIPTLSPTIQPTLEGWAYAAIGTGAAVAALAVTYAFYAPSLSFWPQKQTRVYYDRI